MGNVPRRRGGAGGEEAKPSRSIASDRLRLNIQATQVDLNWSRDDLLQPSAVTLTVHTILPDEYVIAVVEELQRQQDAAPGSLPEVFIRLEVERGPIIEGKLSGGPPALPEEKKGLPG